ncbi:hypothetical protein AVEN_186491-1 [Araneus ventricosus]|uniref:Uncharacterized protein n=1 Tax=Araneus ventricosus TaxID=182803 RepID=A0A4Y2UL50_ARAVE|nr:hypothetical protein AVEN_186491-1 [Araneus ventricosus]
MPLILLAAVENILPSTHTIYIQIGARNMQYHPCQKSNESSCSRLRSVISRVNSPVPGQKSCRCQRIQPSSLRAEQLSHSCLSTTFTCVAEWSRSSGTVTSVYSPST